MKKIRLKDIKAAEAEYLHSLLTWGENNQVTIRAMIKLYELKEQLKKET
jgi:hypothetical protein